MEAHRVCERRGRFAASLRDEWKRFAYLVVLMTFMMFSRTHAGFYPDFLKEVTRCRCDGGDIAMILSRAVVVDYIWTLLAGGRPPQKA